MAAQAVDFLHQPVVEIMRNLSETLCILSSEKPPTFLPPKKQCSAFLFEQFRKLQLPKKSLCPGVHIRFIAPQLALPSANAI